MEEIMLGAFPLWLKHHRDRAEMEFLEPGEFERLARDLAISPVELNHLVDDAHDAAMLSKMLEALGIDQSKLRNVRPALLRSLGRVCSQCDELRECRRAIDRRSARSSYQRFCPNSETLRQLRNEFAP
jgi:hypothetical protein